MKRITLLASFLVTAAAAVIACSDDSSSSGSSSGTTGTSSGGTSSGGTSSGNNGGDTVKSGSVSVTQSKMELPVGDPLVTVLTAASFGEGTTMVSSNGGTSPCTTSTEGACTILECDLSAVDQDAGSQGTEDAGSTKSPHAGVVKVTGLREVTLTPGADGNYEPKSETGLGVAPLFDSGGDVKISAAGADVPAFEKTLKAPSVVALTAPVIPELPDTYELSRTEDLVISWTGGTTGNVSASVSTGDTKKSTTISCIFKADAGTGTISKTALGKLAASGEEGGAMLTIGASTSELVDQGGWKITTSVTAPSTAGLVKVK